MASRTSRAVIGDGKELGLLRVVTCGAVDDGKSTLIGRLLYDLELIPVDELSALERDSAQLSASGHDGLDYSLLVDGLEAERAQGITIDVAYRYFSTARRAFIVADAPGHEQYTRNMASGASTSDVALLLVDIRNGITAQTRRHALIAAHVGVRHVVVAVNKCDLINYAPAPFQRLVDELALLADAAGLTSAAAIPVSARHGVNVVRESTLTPWYKGPTLAALLETLDVEVDRAASAFRMPVQWVYRSEGRRGIGGTLASGRIHVGDEVIIAGTPARTMVTHLSVGPAARQSAVAGEAVLMTLASDVDVSRGDLLADPSAPPDVADRFDARLLWLDDEPLVIGRSYLMRFTTRTVPVHVSAIRERIDIHTGSPIPASAAIGVNELADCDLTSALTVPVDRFVDIRGTGSFVLIDRLHNTTAAAGTISASVSRALMPPQHEVDKDARGRIKGHRPAIVWFTGLSGAGKSTIASAVERRLHAQGIHTYMLDGDVVRGGLARDLGFSAADRIENVRRVAEVARLFVDAGIIVLVALISPFRAEREMARRLVGSREFIEVFVDTPIDVCRARDPKGLYGKADRGTIVNFTGVDSIYEPPDRPDLRLNTVGTTANELAVQVAKHLRALGICG